MLAVDPAPAGTACSVYVTNSGSDSVTVIDGSNNSVIATIAVGAAPSGVVVAPSGLIYVVTTGANTVSVIDASTNTVTASIPVGSHPSGVAVGCRVVPDPSPVRPAFTG